MFFILLYRKQVNSLHLVKDLTIYLSFPLSFSSYKNIFRGCFLFSIFPFLLFAQVNNISLLLDLFSGFSSHFIVKSHASVKVLGLACSLRLKPFRYVIIPLYKTVLIRCDRLLLCVWGAFYFLTFMSFLYFLCLFFTL